MIFPWMENATELEKLMLISKLSGGEKEVTVTGNPVTFTTGKEEPLKGLLIPFAPVQSGSGDPYPAGGGANLLDLDKASYNTLAYGLTVTRDGDGVKITGTATQAGNLAFNLIVDYSGETLGGKGYVLQVFDVTSGYSVPSVWGFRTESERAFAISLDGITQGQVVNCFMRLSVAVTSQTAWSPYSNIRPISGWDGANVYRTGVNVWDEETKEGYYNTISGAYISYSGQLCVKNLISVKPNTTYYCHKGQTTNQGEVLFYDINGDFISALNPSYWINKTFTTPANCCFIAFNLGSSYGTTYNHDVSVSISYPSTDTEYHAYVGNAYPVSFPSEAGTVYGGTIDPVTGVLKVDRAMVDMGTLQWTYNATYAFFNTDSLTNRKVGVLNIISDLFKTEAGSWSGTPKQNAVWGNGSNATTYVQTPLTSVEDFLVLVTGHQLCYELATPIEIPLSDVPQISTLKGQNNLWSDTNGENTVTYKQKR